MDIDKQDLFLLLQESLAAIGYELVDLNYSVRSGLMQVFIDKDEKSGITLDDCAKASRHLSYVLSVKEVDYKNLEISSPGLDRLLRGCRDYEKYSGSMVKVKLKEPLEGAHKLVGCMLWEEGHFFLQVGDRKFRILEESIQKVRLFV